MGLTKHATDGFYFRPHFRATVLFFFRACSAHHIRKAHTLKNTVFYHTHVFYTQPVTGAFVFLVPPLRKNVKTRFLGVSVSRSVQYIYSLTNL